MDRKIIIICTLLLIVFFSCSNFKQSVQGWKFPEKKDLSEDWRAIDPNFFSYVIGDFDGNGKADRAFLAISDDNTQVALIVELNGNKYYIPREFLKSKLPIIGIKKVVSGEYLTACGKGYFDCKNGEFSTVKTPNDSIEVFKYEGDSSLFYWDKEIQSFKEIWISD